MQRRRLLGISASPMFGGSLHIRPGQARAAVVLVLANALAFEGRATAQEGASAPFVLAWSAPEGCPSASEMEARIHRLLGFAGAASRAGGPSPSPVEADPAGPLSHPGAVPLAVRAEVQREGDGFRLSLEAAGQAARSLSGTSCDALADAGALIVAIAIDPTALERATSEPATVEPPPEADPPAGDPAAVRDEAPLEPPETTTPTTSPVRFVASARAALGVGPLSAPSPGAAVGLGLRLDWLELWLEGFFLAEQSVVRGDGTGGSFGVASGRLGACAALAPIPEVEVAPCLGFEGGAMWGQGIGAPVIESGATPWLGVSAAVDGRLFVVPALAFVVGAALQIPVYRGRFVLSTTDPPDLVFSPEVLGFMGSVGILLRVP